MQADRAYQIAAAEFYAGQFDAASADFLRIAADRSSPWHGIAPYLAARALIRKATPWTMPRAAPAAQEQLRKVLADPDAAAWHESARGLSRYLRARTEPGAGDRDLAHAVATEKTGVAGAMNDYRIMLDQYSRASTRIRRGMTISRIGCATMQNGPADPRAREVARHALAAVAGGRADLRRSAGPELMAAAAQVAGEFAGVPDGRVSPAAAHAAG
jgi:hypothetical protein